jgi:hypothetical protein
MTANVLVQFSNVGRESRSWQARLSAWDRAAILREVRWRGGLLSSDVTVEFNAVGGTIFVGGFREVGRFARVAGGAA